MRILSFALLLAVLAASIPTTLAAQAPQWPLYVKKNDRERAINDVRETGRGKYRLLGGVSVQAVWFTDLSLRGWVSNKIDQERLTSAEAEDVYLSMRTKYGMDENYVFFLLANTITQGITEEPLNLSGVILQRSKTADTFTKGRRADEHLNGIGIASPQFSYTVTVPKKLPDGSPIVRSIDDVVELSIATIFEGPAVMKFTVKDYVGKGKRLTSVDQL